MKKYTFEGQKGKYRPPGPKNGIRFPKKYGRVIYPSIGNFTCNKKKCPLGGQKGDNKPSEP
jgi:hypothetical protein